MRGIVRHYRRLGSSWTASAQPISSETRVARRPAGAPKWTLLVALAIATGGCVNPAFRESVGQFGTLTKAAVTTQDQRLAALVASEQDRIRADLAARRADLRLHPDCAARLAADSAGGTDDAEQVPQCTLVELGGRAIEQPPRFDNLLALTGAISNYSGSLTVLAADASEDQAAFAASLSGLAASLGGLDTAIRSAVGAGESSTGAQLGSIATLVAEAGNLYFAYQRNRVLKRIIIQGDPLVQEAVRLLSGADERLQLYERAQLARLLVDSQANLSGLLLANANAPQVRAAQDQLFQRLEAYNRHGQDIRSFLAIGAAHAQLRRAAEAGASAAELRAAIEAILHLAGTAHQTITDLSESSRSSSNDN